MTTAVFEVSGAKRIKSKVKKSDNNGEMMIVRGRLLCGCTERLYL